MSTERGQCVYCMNYASYMITFHIIIFIDSKLARLYKKCGKVYITEAVFNKCMVEVRPLIDVNGLHDYLLKYDLCNDVKKLEGMKKNDRENDPVNNLLCHVSTTGGKHGHFLLYVCLYESTKKGHKSHFDAIEHLQKRGIIIMHVQ